MCRFYRCRPFRHVCKCSHTLPHNPWPFWKVQSSSRLQ